MLGLKLVMLTIINKNVNHGKLYRLKNLFTDINSEPHKNQSVGLLY